VAQNHEGHSQPVQQSNNEVDEYLSALGFLEPSQVQAAGSDFNGLFGQDEQMHAGYMRNWFHGNTALVGAPEEDFTYLDLPRE
jgi:hypothetical protein